MVVVGLCYRYCQLLLSYPIQDGKKLIRMINEAFLFVMVSPRFVANLSEVMMLFFPFPNPRVPRWRHHLITHQWSRDGNSDSILKGPQMFVGESMSQVFVSRGEMSGDDAQLFMGTNIHSFQYFLIFPTRFSGNKNQCNVKKWTNFLVVSSFSDRVFFNEWSIRFLVHSLARLLIVRLSKHIKDEKHF